MTELIVIVTKLLAVCTTLIGLYTSLDARVAVVEHKIQNQTSGVFGFAAGPDMFSPDGCTSVNGAKTCFNHVTVRQASSTLCSIKSPTASSTLADFPQASFTGNAYANGFTWGWATTAFATTTALARLDNVSTAAPAIVATTSQTATIGGGVDGVIPPNTWINLRLSTSSANTGMTYAPVGFCDVSFNVI